MDDQEKVLNDQQEADDAIPVKIKDSIRISIRRAAESVHQAETAAEELRDEAYKAPEYSGGQRKGFSFKDFHFEVKIPPQHRGVVRPAPAHLDDNEKKWAAIAHASALVTVMVSIITGGLAALFALFVPLAIYFVFREKSEYVARHALQAFVAQVVGIIGFFVLTVTVSIVWVILIVISALLIFLLVGIVLLPLVILGGLLALAATFTLPLALLVYGMIATMTSLNGQNYSYPWIGDWVDDQLYGGMEAL